MADYTLLPSSHVRRPEFGAAAELAQRLKAVVRGRVSFDPGSRALYATDASNYRQTPIGVVLPLDNVDVESTMALCREFGAPVLARGGGTSLAGQTCNVAVVLDFSHAMNRLLDLDPDRRRARVQPGIVLDRVREAAERHHLTFAPDPATHSRCTLGGMIGNNSCGVHSVMAGKTVNNIASLDVLLYDGTRMTVGPTSESEIASVIAAGGRRGQLYAGLRTLRHRYADLVRSRFPRIPRRVSGYNLDELLPENGCNVARALVGSEGTCVTVIEAELELVPSPSHRILLGIGYPDVFAAADDVPALLEFGPIGLEGMDGVLVDLMRAKPALAPDTALLPPGRGFLLVEFGGWEPGEAEGQAARCARVFGQRGLAVRVYDTSEARRVWRVRESGLGATAFSPGRPEAWEGWEDAAVAPDKLGSYLRALHKLLARYQYTAPMYGHFGDGCVHMRIDFDLVTEAGILAFRRFLDDATEIVVAHGGSISGEHGDGQARGALLPKMFGPELMQAFREFKRLWDPDNRMNPGKLIDAAEPHADLRLGADYQPWQPKLNFRLASDHGSLAHAASRCVGVGACRKQEGTMCPSYMATGDEKHSTRGRAHLLWEMLQGETLPRSWQNEDVKSALDLCLSCKACKHECPVSVDMATYKAEFLSHYYEGRRRPLAAQIFGHMDQWLRRASRTPRIVNSLTRNSLLSAAAKAALGIHPERRLPSVARAFTTAAPPSAGTGPTVVLWPDTWNNYLHPEILAAAHRVLSAAGFAVQVPHEPTCCGRPLFDFGMLDEARRYLQRVLDQLAPALQAGTPVVVLEPSCASAFRDELPNLLPDDPRAGQLRDQTFLLGGFLAHHAPQYHPAQRDGKILIHGHCHQKALLGMDYDLAQLRATGAEVELLDTGCCGMAGPFGFEKEKYEISRTLAERVLAPRIRSADLSTVTVTDGFSCREQIAHFTGHRALHLAEVLAG